MAVKKWMQGAVNPAHEGSLRKHFKVEEGQNISLDQINQEIVGLQARVKKGEKLSKEDLHLLRQLLFARNARKAVH